MPTILRADGFVVRLHGPPREHPPPHVHVHRGPEGMVVIRLATLDAPLTVLAVFRMKDRDVLKAIRVVERAHLLIEQAWRNFHGAPITD